MTGIGVLVPPFSGWSEWLRGLSVSPEEVVLDVRGTSADDCDSPPFSTELTLLLDQCQCGDWSRHRGWEGHR